MKRYITSLGLCSILTIPALATADEAAPSRLLIPQGMSAVVGGGVGDFVDADMRDMTGTAGFWEARIGFGTRMPIGVEVGYQGGLQTIDSLGLDNDARLLTTGLDATARFNVLTGMVQPYVFGGVGWTRFDLTNFDNNQSSVEDTDDALAVPFGLGVGYRYQMLLGDVRGTYRAIFNEDLVPDGTGDSHQNLDDWSVTARIGFEF